MTWNLINLGNALRNTRVGRQNQVLASEIKLSGRFPVVDQGQAFIAGYTDSEEKLVRDDLPFVVFGDHTRCVKYVDFPFVVGADGTKVLKPREDLFDPKFFYFVVLCLDIPSRGYNRHFSVLREKQVPVPNLDEQRKIAAVLSLVQRAIEQQERLIALTAELKKALMHKLFTEGLRGEPQKQTEIGPIPESWDVVALGSLANKVSKGSSPKWQGFDYVDHGVLFVRSQNVGQGRLEFVDRVYLSAEFNEHEPRSVLKNEDILINLVGASIGRVVLGTNEIEGANCNQAVCFVRIHGPKAQKNFLVQFLLSPMGQQQILFQKKDIARANLSLLDVKSLLVPRPHPEETAHITEVFECLEQKSLVHGKLLMALQELFRTLLHQLMTAQIRVSDLNLDSLNLDSSKQVQGASA